MISKVKQKKNFQRIFGFVNYYLTLGIIGTFTEGFLIGKNDALSNFLIGAIRKLSVLYPRDFTIVLFFVIGILNFFILNFQRNKLIAISFVFNTIILFIVSLVGFFFFMNR